MTLRYTFYLICSRLASLLMKIPGMPMSIFMRVMSSKARSESNLNKLTRAELVMWDKEIFGSLYGKYRS